MKPAPSCAAEADLIAAGKTLAATADPDRDLLNFSDDFRRLARTLKFIGERSEQAYFAAEDKYDVIAPEVFIIAGMGLGIATLISVAVIGGLVVRAQMR